ncbi:hypothetical protein ACVRXF_01895 [Streptococcus orisasini]
MDELMTKNWNNSDPTQIKSATTAKPLLSLKKKSFFFDTSLGDVGRQRLPREFHA